MHKLQIIRIRKLENQKFAYLPKNCFKKFFTKKAHEKKHIHAENIERTSHMLISQKRKLSNFKKVN